VCDCVMCSPIAQDSGEAHGLLFTDVLYLTKKHAARPGQRDTYKLKAVVRFAAAVVNESRIKKHPYAFEV
jgi:hypothetical protein